jgi:putative ABC transport system permease protein
VSFFDSAVQDLRYAVRTIQRSPGFTALAVFIMALGIGANAAVFSVVNGVLLKPLSFREPDRILTLASAYRESQTVLAKQVSIPDFRDWHDQSSSFEAMAYYTSRETAVTLGSTAEYGRVAAVSPEFFRVFGVEPVAGRFATEEEMKAGNGRAALISYRYWQSRFGGDPHALGKLVSIVPAPRPIVGVLPPGFQFPQETDVWIPVSGLTGERSAQNYLAIAKLKRGVSLERAQDEMTLIGHRLEQQYPDSNKGRTVAVSRMRDEMVGNVRVTLYLLLGAVTLVLLIACTNTGTLLLSKATTRTREIALRGALGASRERIVRQVVTESLLLAFMAGALGLLLAYWGSKILVALAPADLPRLGETGIDVWVLGFSLVLSMLTSFLFGLVPAHYTSKVDLNEALKQGGTRPLGGREKFRVRGLLVAAEIALAVVLLCGAGLLIKSLVALQNVALGFRPENVLVMRATVPVQPSVAIERARKFFKDALSEIVRLPGVTAAGATMAPPGSVESTGKYFVDWLPPQSAWSSAPGVVLSIIAPGTLKALGIPLKGGL